MAKGRIDAADTVDNATHYLHRLQADGWTVKEFRADYDQATPASNGKAGAILPVAVTVTVKLIASH